MGFNLPSRVYLPPELDTKAKNLHARMAIFFDNNIYKEPEQRNDTLLYQYIYHIIKMLARTKKFFNSEKEYDEFSHYTATKLYLRYINPEHTKKHGKIKSVLNYCKSLLYPCKVDFQRETFDEIIGTNNKGENDGLGEALNLSMESSIQNDYCRAKNLIGTVLEELNNVSDIVYKTVKESPYKENTEMFHRLYISVLLSLLNGVSLSDSCLNKINNKNDIDKILVDLYKKETENNTILWRLDTKYTGLVLLLTVKAKRLFSQKILMAKRELEMSPEELSAIIMSAYGNTLRDDNEEI